MGDNAADSVQKTASALSLAFCPIFTRTLYQVRFRKSSFISSFHTSNRVSNEREKPHLGNSRNLYWYCARV